MGIDVLISSNRKRLLYGHCTLTTKFTELYDYMAIFQTNMSTFFDMVDNSGHYILLSR